MLTARGAIVAEVRCGSLVEGGSSSRTEGLWRQRLTSGRALAVAHWRRRGVVAGGRGVVSIRLGRQLVLEERGADMWFPPLHVIHVSKITHHENLMTKYELF